MAKLKKLGIWERKRKRITQLTIGGQWSSFPAQFLQCTTLTELEVDIHDDTCDFKSVCKSLIESNPGVTKLSLNSSNIQFPSAVQSLLPAICKLKHLEELEIYCSQLCPDSDFLDDDEDTQKRKTTARTCARAPETRLALPETLAKLQFLKRLTFWGIPLDPKSLVVIGKFVNVRKLEINDFGIMLAPSAVFDTLRSMKIIETCAFVYKRLFIWRRRYRSAR